MNNKRIAIYAFMIFGALAATALLAFMIHKVHVRHNAKLSEREASEERRIDGIINDVKDAFSIGKYPDAFKAAMKLGKADLNKEQTFTRYRLLASIALKLYQNSFKPNERKYYANMTLTFLHRAQEHASNHEQKKEINRIQAKLLMDEGQWEKALATIRENYSYLMPFEERWRAEIREAECLYHINQITECLKLLSHVADDADDEEIWAEALVKKGDILLRLSRDKAIYEEYLKELGDETEAPTMDQLRGDAHALFNTLAKTMSPVNPQRGAVDLGLLKIYAAEGKRQQAYNLSNEMIVRQISERDKALALIQLADLEEKMNNPDKAATVLNTCLKRYATPAMRPTIAKRLYDLYVATKRWDDVLRTTRLIFRDFYDISEIKNVLRDFFHGRDSILDKMSGNGVKVKYLTQVRDILGNLRIDKRGDQWRSISHEVNFIYARISYELGEYDQAEKRIQECLDSEENSRELLGNLYYLDLKCALKPTPSPPLIFFRGWRYLDEFPQGEHYDEVLHILLKTYYQAKLYEEALDVAKRIYVDEIAKAKERAAIGKDTAQPKWLATVAKIAQCYEKLGEDTQANRIFRNYADDFLDEPFAPEAYQSWAALAEREGQLREALRRLSVVARKTKDSDTRIRLDVSRAILKLKLNMPASLEFSLGMIDMLRDSDQLPDKMKNDLSKELYDETLRYCFNNQPRRANAILNQALNDFPDAQWTEYWILRSLTPLFGTAELETLGKRHEETLKNDFANSASRETFNFISRQVDLINKLVAIENKSETLKKERDL